MTASSQCDTLIRQARIIDGNDTSIRCADVAITGDRIVAVGEALNISARNKVDADGLTLAPGFIDTHTHDDTSVIETPQMLPKISQGVTTVIVGNCGISAAPVTLRYGLPDPMNLLGDAGMFRYPHFADYVAAVQTAQPAVNVGALVGHTALRNNHMDRLDRPADSAEIEAMRLQLQEALEHGALGLSTGLAYGSANAATAKEVLALMQPLEAAGGIYATHLRSETATILDALHEAFEAGDHCGVPVIVSHLKCAGIDNWGRAQEVLQVLDRARATQQIGWDCYPYAAGSSTLDLRQVDERVKITITWSEPHPEMAGSTLAQIAAKWKTAQLDAARKLQPAGAIYHSISEEDMRLILGHPATMIGSDGLPHDPRPHPRLWGTFPRVLGRYCREEKLFTLPEAIRKMTWLPAQRFGLRHRGAIREGYFADMVLFDAERITDTATFTDSQSPSAGIVAVWVNGTLSYGAESETGRRSGRYLFRSARSWAQ
ncbi:N-acyl-D-amino-acid deacylase family protein [Acidobacterium capsulatum]|uniref:N-acyl-D-aspartate deacylase n=1 Tax=Acidobacterium capsulatum (strain ATCC 51196 / DSM 11244 / BCRC 80197 / JCM 7670 / NBRC 15755 / NCIMB 13165 / 161) TaxID=240015 RepID=C1F7Z1_ACIC5|nr:D-aminoacylase [Acidobacterium capsulatum]ACO34134.1 N-acyl-D-aspartate deacylase [Acidobacterium capsulatum ATCC 51196]HCT59314.1 D-aminoacylase [Acidobacterium sp.]